MSDSSAAFQAVSAPSSATDRLAKAFPTFAGAFGNLGWPILVRQLRADFRKPRFFLTQFICLAALAGILLALIVREAADETRTATQIGQELFQSFFIFEYLTILLIFPAFSATAFSEERTGQTMDLLLVTALRPTEIVWGKFLASTAYCLVYVIGSIPLLSIAFLFGGIELKEAFLAYALLIGATLFVAMLGVAISAWNKSSTRSTMMTYCAIFLLFLISWVVYSQLQAATVKSPGTLLRALGQWGGPGLSLSPLHLALLSAALFALFFIAATNCVRPAAQNRSSALRVLGAATLGGFCVLSIAPRLDWDGSKVVGLPAPSRWFEDLLIQAAVMLLVFAFAFPTEPAEVSPRNRSRYGRWTGARYLLRAFAPGAFWGVVFVIGLAALCSLGLLAAWKTWFASLQSAGMDVLISEALLTLPIYIAAVASFGFFLATWDFSPIYARFTAYFVFVITLLLPVIWYLSKSREDVWTSWDVIWRGYYLSPLTLWFSLEAGSDDRSQFLLFDRPIVEVARWVLAGAAGIFLIAGAMLARRAGYPLFRFPARPLPRARAAG